ncbi:hypothetical protein SUGI_0008830 [Cryptomeria japonica]|nr:hypothetical protein SUGI_0008830 [Cryptomeria japonica]
MAPLKTNPHRRVHPITQDNIQNLLVEDDVSNPTAQCLVNAVHVLISSYSEVIKSISNPKQCQSEVNSKVVNGCLDGLVQLLDRCSKLKDIIVEMGHYDMLLHKAIRYLDGTNFSEDRAKAMLANCMDAVKSKGMSTRCSSVSRLMVQKLGCIDISSTSLFQDLQKLNECTAFVLKTSEKCCTRRSTKSRLVRCYSRLTSFCESTMDHGFTSSLYELHMVDVSVRMLYDLLAKKSTNTDGLDVRERVECLKSSRVELRKGISLLSKKIEELYNILIRTRMSLLDFQSYSI